jgi:c-di-GMP-binding flagellar brake protein YcgR
MLHQKSGEERRQALRMKIFQPAAMTMGRAGAEARVHLLNISTGGALVYGEAVPRAGAAVQLDCGIALGSAQVAWVSGRRFGVRFDTPIAPAQVEAVLQLQNEMIESGNQRLGLVCAA